MTFTLHYLRIKGRLWLQDTADACILVLVSNFKHRHWGTQFQGLRFKPHFTLDMTSFWILLFGWKDYSLLLPTFTAPSHLQKSTFVTAPFQMNSCHRRQNDFQSWEGQILEVQNLPPPFQMNSCHRRRNDFQSGGADFGSPKWHVSASRRACVTQGCV